MTSLPDPGPENLLRTVRREFPRDPRIVQLFEVYLDGDGYRRGLVDKLLQLVRSRSETWDLRRLAALMLEHQAWQIPAGDAGELDFLLSGLRLKQPGDAEVSRSVLKEGYSTTELRGFMVELRRKLSRHDWVFRAIAGRRTAKRALGDFIHLSRRDCKLALGRYLFAAEEVTDRIERQVTTSSGTASKYCQDLDYLEQELRYEIARLPDFEARILRRLWASPVIYWVSEATGSEINSLVEYPLGTVVLVVKPPGSEIEIEIKRAGRRGKHPLGVVFQRKGYLVANMHRLDGGSSVHFLRHEAAAAARFSEIYRLVHGVEAPLSKTLSIAGTYTVPVNGREAYLLDYFTDRKLFGKRYSEMRKAMHQSIVAFDREWGAWVEDLPGDLGLTVEFLAQIPPGQAILVRSSSFRVDLLATYLSSDGPRKYFEEGLGVDCSKDQARRFADEVLEEVLGVYAPPQTGYRDHEQYLEEAFRVARNRALADRYYLQALRQLGTVWGTLLGVRGYSNGESFVARNVGLKSVWEDGRWNVKLIFMDQDGLQVSWGFDPKEILEGMVKDDRLVFGTEGRWLGKGTIELLGKVYRADAGLAEKGLSAFQLALEGAYRKTRAAVSSDRRLRKRFKTSHFDKSRDWDRLVRSYLDLGESPESVERWRARWAKTLADRGLRKKTTAKHLKAVEDFADLLRKHASLYRSPSPSEDATPEDATPEDATPELTASSIGF